MTLYDKSVITAMRGLKQIHTILFEEMSKMTPQEHKDLHKKLHESLDELLADFITHTGKLPSKTNIFELTKWSAEQTDNPTEE